MRRKKSGWLCFLLIPVILAMGLWRLWDAWGVPETGTYGEADRVIAAFAKENGLKLSDYPAELRALLERNPETEDFVLHYPLNRGQRPEVDLSAYEGCEGVPLFLQWDRQWGSMEYGGKPAALTGCGPVCLSMAAYYLTGDEAFSPDRMIEFAKDGGYYSPGSGSSWTLISEGGVKLGFEVTEIPLVKQRILDNLKAGNPIICAMGKGDFTTSGHFIVLVGEEDGMLRVNDPNSRANSEKLWKFEDIESQFRNLWVIRK